MHGFLKHLLIKTRYVRNALLENTTWMWMLCGIKWRISLGYGHAREYEVKYGKI